MVCRIINYDKYRYYLDKKEKEQRKVIKKVGLKEIRLGVRIGTHDLEFKRRKAAQFLKAGHKVKIELVLKGRERAHRELGRDVIDNFLANLKEEDSLQVDQPVMNSPRGFSCIVVKKS